MPQYEFECECGHTDFTVCKVKDRNKPLPCKKCNRRMKRTFSAPASTDKHYDKPVYSTAAAVLPRQVAEHRRRFPDIEITDDGRPIFRSHNQRKKALKQLGLMDKDSFY